MLLKLPTCNFYRPQGYVFTGVRPRGGVCVARGGEGVCGMWQGGCVMGGMCDGVMHGRGACVAGGHAWWGACVAGGRRA